MAKQKKLRKNAAKRKGGRKHRAFVWVRKNAISDVKQHLNGAARA